MEEKQRIPMSTRRRLRVLATGGGPVLAWVAAAAVAALLAAREGRTYTVRGLAQENRTPIVATVPGRVASMPVEYLDRVDAGQVVAVIDDAVVRGEIEVVRAEAAMLQARIAAERARLENEAARTAREEIRDHRRLTVDLESARLDALDRRAEIEVARIELQRLRFEENRLSHLSEIGVMEQAARDAVRFEADGLQKFIDEGTATLAEATRRVDDARARLAESDGGAAADMAARETQAAIDALERESDEVAARMKALEATLPDMVLRSPVTGIVAAAHAMTGSGVVEGTWVAEVAGVSTNVVVAWMPEDAPVRPAEGDLVHVIPEGRGGKPMPGRVANVAEGVLMMPPKILRDVRRPEYGMPVRVILDDAVIACGRSVAVRFAR